MQGLGKVLKFRVIKIRVLTLGLEFRPRLGVKFLGLQLSGSNLPPFQLMMQCKGWR